MNSKKDKFTFSRYTDIEEENVYVNMYMSRKEENYNEKNNASLKVNFSSSIISEGFKYDMSIANITCDIQTLPILLYNKVNMDNPNLAETINVYPMWVGLRHVASGDFYEEEVKIISSENLNSRSNFVNSYNTIADMFQDAFESAITALNADHGGTIPSDSLFFYFDESDGKFKFVLRGAVFYNSGSPTVEIFVNSNSRSKIFHGFTNFLDYSLFFNKTFSVQANDDPATEILVNPIYGKACNGFPNFEDDPAGSFIRIAQEYKTIGSLTSQMGIRVISSLTGITPENFSDPFTWDSNGNSQPSKVENLIGDFFADYENPGDTRGKVIFYPTSTPSFHDLNKFEKISTIDATLLWVDKEGNSYGFRPEIGQMFCIKYLFKKKRKYLTQRVKEVDDSLINRSLNK